MVVGGSGKWSMIGSRLAPGCVETGKVGCYVAAACWSTGGCCVLLLVVGRQNSVDAAVVCGHGNVGRRMATFGLLGTVKWNT
ncbi:hypothetical protein KY285_003493 [Solanum tuberosum]|nr:hypothetical protein KY284_003643 [Solanum tuberosum]KAH0732650.1 hypothetical protein KY289_003838 [Solanum tuberosum]KAH0767622.1 hypothetical protein KY285_003493 [Solanum tuberosum]